MIRTPPPLDLWRASLEMLYLGVETQMVVAMRLLGFAGVWSVTPDETSRMFGEKLPAFANAALAAQSSAWHGGRPDQIMVAAINPLRERTFANSQRLSQNGLRRKQA